ncbi:circularly permuted type 2 ATP-grasp protein [Gluconacetobacter tumulisoli]|uniref:Circularly permuted type 2 ATP-grasp protein n=1 Tax=Gluconacetobacter tumulisoli TaxID=1286189 RepID=A0A7W4PL98_9PROT|nr:circularly permuted type 2 ATP-grasp protein [Gluconacetobacter tumulisoli]MBB2201578.1 circularly permuted type 2 ATP-grasp protein [Gluconacetobacter tumulisoli]
MNLERIPLDEMVDGRGGVRPHWRGLLGTISDLGHRELLERARQMARSLHDQTGVAGAAASLAGGCDPVPLLLTAQEFARLGEGIVQRARILEETLRDLYGPRTLLADGVLPPALVYPARGFLRMGDDPASKPEAPARRFLSFYSADLIRGPDGAWRVVADRVARANGIGRALENRRQMARVLPELFSGREVRRLTPFFESWQDSLQRLADLPDRNPGLALLTPGPRGPHWAEHVILARELGCVLAEAGDLTVRDGALWLKTVRGLRRVDVLLLRQDGWTVDPLELDGGPVPGIAGLLDAARGGAVHLVNDPAAGVVEAPGVAAFMPDLAARFLDQDLLLPDIRTIWLGGHRSDAGRLDDLLAGDRSRWWLRPVADAAAPARRLDRQTDEAIAALRRAPDRFVAVEALSPSVMPSIQPGGIEPGAVVLRLFALFDGADWQVLPGGLARLLPDADAPPGRPWSGQVVTKDVWVTAEDSTEIIGAAVLPTMTLAIRRGQGDLPSRAADDFFWLGRYLEQLEDAGRVLRIVTRRIGRVDGSPRERVELETMLRLAGHVGLLQDEPASGAGFSTLVRTLSGVTFDSGLPQRLLSEIARVAAGLQDRLTAETYDTVVQGTGSLRSQLQDARVPGDPGRTLERIERVTDGLLRYGATISGLTAENMVRNGGRQFLDLGRRIERAGAILTSVALVLQQKDVAQRGRMEGALRLMLELSDCVITYRSRYFAVLQPAPVLDLLLLDEGNPRGVASQLAMIGDALADLGQADPDRPLAEQAAGADLVLAVRAIMDRLRGVVGDVLAAPRQDSMAATLPDRILDIRDDIRDLARQIARRYFVVLMPPRAVGGGHYVDRGGTGDES